MSARRIVKDQRRMKTSSLATRVAPVGVALSGVNILTVPEYGTAVKQCDHMVPLSPISEPSAIKLFPVRILRMDV